MLYSNPCGHPEKERVGVRWQKAEGRWGEADIRGLHRSASCSQMTLGCLNQSGVVQVQPRLPIRLLTELPGAELPGWPHSRAIPLLYPTHRQPSPTAANMPRAATVCTVQQPPPCSARTIHWMTKVQDSVRSKPAEHMICTHACHLHQ